MSIEQKARQEIRMKFLNISKRYQNASNMDFENSTWEAALKASWIEGKAGAGKTHLLVALAKYCVMQSLDHKKELIEYNGILTDAVIAAYISVPELIAEINNTYSFESERTVEDVVELYCTAQHLFLDDFGTEKMTDAVFQTLYRIIDYRWANMLPIIVASNLKLEEMADGMSERLASRILGMGNVVQMNGKDRRSCANNS